ncbi:MAG: hypothetical protein IJ317_02295, partial [Clostridia bacterium]|nr:hypothetical protein [Clostridia bacterium]
NIRENHYTMRHEQGYGYQIWITKQGFALSGMGSQFVFAFPEKNFMFVCQGDTQCNADAEGDYIYEQLVHEIYEYLQAEALPVGSAYDTLQKELKDLQLNVDYGEAHTPFEKEIDGVRYELEENPMGWKWFRFDFMGEQGELTYENQRGVKTLAFGCNSLKKGTFPETHYYDKQVDVASNRELDCMTDVSWTEEKKILLRTYIADSNLGSCFMTFGFKGDEVGVMMNKRAEFFMDDYVGFAGGRRV